MSNKKYRLSFQAKQDLLAIFEFTITHWGEKQARIYAQQLSDGFEMLSDNPRVGKSRNELFENAMSFVIGSHIVFYSINQNQENNIEVARILHQSMDFQGQF